MKHWVIIIGACVWARGGACRNQVHQRAQDPGA